MAYPRVGGEAGVLEERDGEGDVLVHPHDVDVDRAVSGGDVWPKPLVRGDAHLLGDAVIEPPGNAAVLVGTPQVDQAQGRPGHGLQRDRPARRRA